MKIKTITCHDVYNLGASLQAYALAEYLKCVGHDVQIIDYKPEYLSRHYDLGWVANPRFNRPIVRQLYLIAKLPQRLLALKSWRKKHFDDFRQAYLPVTKKSYDSYEKLLEDCPEADIYIAGSDQIWNPVFPNGKDPAFFLTFVPKGKKRISYAASFAVDYLSLQDSERMKPWLEGMDAVSVREKSGVGILADLGIQGKQVMDPVFLLERQIWEEIAVKPKNTGYLLVYDFDGSNILQKLARTLADSQGKQVISVFPMDGASEVWNDMGPREFLGAILNADIIISNSFHATAFSLIFQKELFVVNREEKINTRMRDLLKSVDLENRLISDISELSQEKICWGAIEKMLGSLVSQSKDFLMEQITG